MVKAKMTDADELKRTPLHVAASEGKTQACRLLLSLNCDITAKDAFENTALNDAVRGGHDETAKLLRTWDGDEANTSSKLVAKKVAMLQQADLEEKSKEVLTNRVDLAGKQAGVSMCEAAAAGDLVLMRRLIENGVHPDEGDYDARTGIHLASSEGHLPMVRLLIKHGADVNVRDRFGLTALDDAVRHGHTQVQRLLREHGGCLAPHNMGVKMCEAAAEDDVSSLQVLITNGIEPSTADYDMRTAMHLASSVGNVTILDLLLKIEGVEVNPVDRLGGTPLEDAHRHQKAVAAQMLTHAGGLRVGDPRLEVLKAAQVDSPHARIIG